MTTLCSERLALVRHTGKGREMLPEERSTMPSKKSTEQSGHTPVSNEATEVSAVAKKSQVEKAAEGTNPKAGATEQGYEVLKGFRLPSSLAGAGTEAAGVLTAPDTSGLRDIGEASFGAPLVGALTVHTPDNRVQVTATANYPWRVHASLLITARDGSQWIGTGWFIGPHTLMTAGHVVYIKNSGVPGRDGWVRTIQVMPGRNGNAMPYGSVTSTSFRSVTGWTNNGDENYDYGAILIPNNLGNTVGWLGFGAFSDTELLSSVGNISGYPGDKPTGTQWYDARRIASVGPRKVFYDIDTAGGQSGSGVYRIMNGSRYGVAVHAYGGSVTNSGTRITTPVFNNMLAWKA